MEEALRIYNPQIEIEELKKYLISTDWYVVRKIETGIEILEEISNKRSEARKRIDVLQFEECLLLKEGE